MNGFDVNLTTDGNGVITVSGSSNIIRKQNDYAFLTIATDDPLLGPLAANGGPTMTHAPVADSPAVNAGSNSQGLVTDQRGSTYSRVVGGSADIGAVELQTTATVHPPGDYNEDNNVDAADYVVWRKTLGATVTPYSGADGDGSGSVQPGDYDVWRTNFGSTTAAAGIASAVEVARLDLTAVPLIVEVTSTDSARGTKFQAFADAGKVVPTERRYLATVGGKYRTHAAADPRIDAGAYDLALLNITLGRGYHLPGIVESEWEEFATDDSEFLSDLATEVGQDLAGPFAIQNL